MTDDIEPGEGGGGRDEGVVKATRSSLDSAAQAGCDNHWIVAGRSCRSLTLKPRGPRCWSHSRDSDRAGMAGRTAALLRSAAMVVAIQRVCGEGWKDAVADAVRFQSSECTTPQSASISRRGPRSSHSIYAMQLPGKNAFSEPG